MKYSILFISFLIFIVSCSNVIAGSWSYYKDVTITGQSGAGTDYQVRFEIGDSVGGDFHLEGHCTNFPQDIGVTDDDGITMLDFWIEDITEDPIIMYVKVADNLESNQTIRVYYGESGATTNSNGTATFPDFFEDNEIYSDGYDIGNVWTLIQDKATINEYSTDAAKTGNMGIKIVGIVGAGTGSSAWNKTNPTTLPYGFQSWLYVGSADTSTKFCGFSWSQGDGMYMLLSGYNNANWQLRYGGNYHTSTLLVTTGWHKIELKAIADGSAVVYIDGVELSESFPVGEIDDNEIIISQHGAETSYYDDLFLRKYNDPEPVFDIAGVEEIIEPTLLDELKLIMSEITLGLKSVNMGNYLVYAFILVGILLIILVIQIIINGINRG